MASPQLQTVSQKAKTLLENPPCGSQGFTEKVRRFFRRIFRLERCEVHRGQCRWRTGGMDYHARRGRRSRDPLPTRRRLRDWLDQHAP